MATYIHFTEEQKRSANQVDLVELLQRRGEKLLPSGREKRLASDHSITVRGNEWYDHAAEQGGYAIDFVRKFYGLSFPEAVTMLLGGECGTAYHTAQPRQEEPPKPFVLPPAFSEMRRAYAYLVKTRCLDREVVNFFAKQKLIYESCEKSKDGTKEYHNAVFVGRDENGIARHAHKRGIYTNGSGFKGNVDGSDPRYSFHHISSNDRLLVFEAPIDLLSYLSLAPDNWQAASYVALCGVGGQAMQWMLEQNPQLRRVALCLDNDEAGHKASARLAEGLKEKGYLVEREVSQAKDWNEDLQNTHAEPMQDAHAMQMA